MSSPNSGEGRLAEEEKMSGFTPVNTHSTTAGNGGAMVVGQKPPSALPSIAPAPHHTNNSSPVSSSNSSNAQEDQRGRAFAELAEQSISIQKRKRSPEVGSSYHPLESAYLPQKQQQVIMPSNQLQPPQTPQTPQQLQPHNQLLPAPSQNPPLSPALRPIPSSMKNTPSGDEEIPNSLATQDNGSERGRTADEDTPMVDQHQSTMGLPGHAPFTPILDGDKKPRKRQFSNRTKTGCLTCRRRKKKCDEGKPECHNCKRGGFNCEGYTGKINWTKPPGKTTTGPVPIHSKVEEGSASASPTLPSGQSLPQHSPGHHLPADGVAHLLQSPGAPAQTIAATSSYNASQPPAPPSPHADLGTRPPSGLTQDLVTDPNAKSERDKMLAGELFYANTPDLEADRQRCKSACYRFNNAVAFGTSKAEHERLLHEVLKPRGQWGGNNSIGQGVTVETPFNCTYGYNITVEDNALIAGGVTVLDSNEVIIKKRAIIEANCTIYTTSRPFDPRKREGGNGPQKAQRVVIGEDAWLAGNVTVLPGVTIGKGAVIGAGSVVTKDVPPFTVSYGNPASVMRGIYSNGIDS